MTRSTRWFALLACSAALLACDDDEPTAALEGPTPSAAVAKAASASASASAPAPSVSAPAPDHPKTSKHALTRAEFVRLFVEASEPDRYFFSDNYVSNETSYLQVAGALHKRAGRGGGYIGVGPEQNFSYVALLKPDLAFIVDIRRANAVEHLWYKALFEDASSRFSFLAELIGRAAPRTEESDVPLKDILERVEALPKSDAGYARIATRSRERIASWGVELSKSDLKLLASTQQAFFEKGLSLAFELHEKNGRNYPSLKALLQQTAPKDDVGGFLSSAASFQYVQQMQRENRIIPVVGDFGGEHALKRVGAELRRRDLPVHTFYVSNVEQYLLEPQIWPKWVANIGALPSNETSVFIRCYLDQGKRHPNQLQGHRTATVLSSFDHFKWRTAKKPYKSFYEISSDGVLDP
ncbi:MAG TPA: hypothetical protein PKD61_29745 [Polyangiaceae bacterium]|nr:hypothetical protein [Polyangiaceae bacterium]